jgi:hypothetical protein
MKMQQLTNEALEAFWQVIVKHFPKASTGDLSSALRIRLQVAAEHAIKEWLDNNVSSENRIPVECDSAISALYAYLDNNHVKLVGYGSFIALSPDRQTLFGCPELRDGMPEPNDTLPGHLNWGEVTAPEDQGFLDAVNRILGTSFRLEDFAGR